MPNSTCLFDGCEKLRQYRDWCPPHYMELRRRGDLPAKLCRGCGAPCPGQRHYCDEECKPKCGVYGCRHIARRNGLCSSHETQRRQGIELRELAYKSKGSVCEFCGGPSGVVKGYRRACSPRCSRMLNRHGGPLPDTFKCILCSEDFPYVVEGRRRKKANTRMCVGCLRASLKHGYSPAQLAKRDGLDCGLCGELVDLSLRHPHLMRGSVDHIIPTSLGGSNAPENVQLAHLHCNIKKNNRVEASSMR